MKYLSILFFSIFFFSNVSPAFACLCDGTPTVTEELKGATAIFSGKYVGGEYRKGIVNEFRRMEEEIDGKKIEYEVLVLRFQVEKWWKGNLSNEVILVTDQTKASDGTTSVGDCGLGFEKGKRYLIYAYGKEDELGTDACTRTKKLKRAKEDLKQLGKGNDPFQHSK
jgi:hypothetical protein